MNKEQSNRIFNRESVRIANIKIAPGENRDDDYSGRAMEQIESVVSEIENNTLEVIEMDD